ALFRGIAGHAGQSGLPGPPVQRRGHRAGQGDGSRLKSMRPRDTRMLAKESTTMQQEITPIAVRPWTLNGISERMIVSHYENNYGGAVRTLNAIRSELAGLETGMPWYRIRALKREELIAMGSVALHELYFGNLGGEGNKIPDPVRAMLEEHFG